MRNVFFVLFAVLLLTALVAIAVRHYLRAQRTAESTWEDILKRLVWVDRDNIAMIALDVINELGEPQHGANGFALEPSAIWTLLGGLHGLEALEHNCHVLVELTTYVQRFYPEALIVAEQLRLNAKEIEWHIGRLKSAANTGNLQSSFADYAQRAVVTYYLMTRHVLDLYDQTNSPGLIDLQQAL